LTADNDAVIRLWDTATGGIISSREVVFSVNALSPDGKFAISDQGALYDIDTGKKLLKFFCPP
jgi:hypothetical protein